jgi:hypothetical protein
MSSARIVRQTGNESYLITTIIGSFSLSGLPTTVNLDAVSGVSGNQASAWPPRPGFLRVARHPPEAGGSVNPWRLGRSNGQVHPPPWRLHIRSGLRQPSRGRRLSDYRGVNSVTVPARPLLITIWSRPSPKRSAIRMPRPTTLPSQPDMTFKVDI